MKNKVAVATIIECAECSKHLTQSVIKTGEGTDYVRYFCGVECYEKWLNKQKENGSIQKED